MAVDNTERQAFMGPALTEKSLIFSVQVPKGGSINLIDQIKSAVVTAGVPFPNTIDIVIYPTATDTSSTCELRTSTLVPGFPIPHLPAGGGADPSPLRLNIAGITTLLVVEIVNADDANLAMILYY
jgi:hypothetical protein